jgi:DNA repair exonuclease SbcCD ATPase subunit
MTKQYTIEINGVVQSADAIESLIKKLSELDSRLGNIKGVDTSKLAKSLKDIQTNIDKTSFEDLNKQISDVTKEIDKLEKSTKAINSNPIDKLANSLKGLPKADVKVDTSQVSSANKEVDQLEKNLASIAEKKLGISVSTNIGGLQLEFDDTNQAIGILEDKMYQLAVSGKQNTAEYKALAQQIAQFRIAVINTDKVVDNLVSGGLDQMVRAMGSISAIGAIGAGIGGLFGVEEVDESIQKFAQLSLVLQGVQTLQKELQDTTSLTSKAYQTLVKYVDPAADAIGKFVSKISGFDWVQNTAEIGQLGKATLAFNEALLKAAEDNDFSTLEESLKNLGIEFDEVDKDIVTTAKLLGDVTGIQTRLQAAFDEGLIDEATLNAANDALADYAANLTDSQRAAQANLATVTSLRNQWDKLPAHLKLTQKALSGVATGIKAVGVAFKSLLKATIILGVIQMAIEAITWAIDKLVVGFKWMMGMDLAELADGFKSLENNIANANEQLTKFKKELDNLVDTKAIDSQTKINELLKIYNEELGKAIENAKKYTDDAAALDFGDVLDTWWTGSNISDMEDFRKEYELLQKAVIKGQDRVEAGSGGNFLKGWWHTAGDAAADYASMQQAVIRDIQNQIKSLNTDNIDEFIALLEDPIYADALANIEELFPEEEWAKALKAIIQQIKDYYAEIEQLGNDAVVEQKKIQDAITANNIAAIKNRFEKERQELENNYRKELEDAANNEELKLSVERKYATLRQQLLKNQGNEVRGIQNSITNNEIAAMREGLDKKLAEIEQQRKQEIDAAKDSEILVNEQIQAINKKYDAQVLDAKKDFYESRVSLLVKFKDQYVDLALQIAQLEAEYASSKVLNDANDAIDALTHTGDLSAVKEYYTEIAKIQNEAAAKQAQINEQLLSAQINSDVNDEKRRYEERIDELEDYLKTGMITQAEYDEQIRLEITQHNQLLTAIEQKGVQDRENIQREYLQTTKNNTITAYNEMIREISDMDVSANIETTGLGIIDYKETKKNLEQAKAVISDRLKAISSTMDDLTKDYKAGKISFGDFKQAKKELDSLAKETEQAAKDVDFNLKGLLSVTIESITQLASSYVNQLSGLWNTFNEIQMMRIEQEQEVLEAEYDMLEEQYEKQEELVKKHTDKISDIEAELKTARGDRRAHLIEQLAMEKAAQKQALIEEQNALKAKEENQKKQDAVEKKRREQEKKNSIVQATINTFTAVTNALAVQPWFVGLALSAVALALGLANIAQIKKQKYAKGGLLVGKSHAMGGIPVGNTGIEVEGDEYIINKKSTAANLPLISYINSQKRTITKDDLNTFFDSGKANINKSFRTKFADGGQLPNMPEPARENTVVITDDRPIVAQIVDIVNSADSYRQIQVLSGLSGKSV